MHWCARSECGACWSVTRYADIMTVELDHETYSSASERGGITIRNQPLGKERPCFFRMDPPRHAARRKTVAPVAAPTNLAHVRPTRSLAGCRLLSSSPRHPAIPRLAP